MNEVSLLLQRKQLTIFVASDKIKAFMQNLEVQNFSPPYCNFLMFMNFPHETGGYINDCDYVIFLYYKMKYVNIWKIYINQYDNIS